MITRIVAIVESSVDGTKPSKVLNFKLRVIKHDNEPKEEAVNLRESRKLQDIFVEQNGFTYGDLIRRLKEFRCIDEKGVWIKSDTVSNNKTYKHAALAFYGSLVRLGMMPRISIRKFSGVFENTFGVRISARSLVGMNKRDNPSEEFFLRVFPGSAIGNQMKIGIPN